MSHNALAQALINAGHAKVTDKRGLAREGWGSKLSYRTYQALEKQGIPANPHAQAALQAKADADAKAANQKQAEAEQAEVLH